MCILHSPLGWSYLKACTQRSYSIPTASTWRSNSVVIASMTHMFHSLHTAIIASKIFTYFSYFEQPYFANIVNTVRTPLWCYRGSSNWKHSYSHLHLIDCVLLKKRFVMQFEFLRECWRRFMMKINYAIAKCLNTDDCLPLCCTICIRLKQDDHVNPSCTKPFVSLSDIV